VRAVRAQDVNASERLSICARMIVEEQAHGGSASNRVAPPFQSRIMAKNANKMNGLDHKFCIAPMMEWTDRHCRFFHRLLTRRW